MLIPYLIEFLLQEKRAQPPLVRTIVGLLSIVGGIIFGGYVLFNYMVPVIGYNEAGLVISLGLICIGIAFLKIPGYKKKPAPEFLKLFQALQNQIDLPNFIKGNGKKALVLSAIGGILLTQLLKSSKK